MTRAAWFSPTILALVVAGGALGVAARAALILPIPQGAYTQGAYTQGAYTQGAHPLVVPAVTMAINIVGSLLLGVVVGRLGERHAHLRAFFGTGVLGGFTTYSAFAVHAVTLGSANPLAGLLLMALSVFGGALAAALGLQWGLRRGSGEVPPADTPAPEDAE
ncbi:fluoride efflux transporter FluC [Microbacterium sp. bgisy203]|uniref:fluoride efflux transporter FluC n=1 Tax=Microbacterium sp. bgisy203 TaxID=3413799 RepID=UPI003D74074E